MKQTYQTPETVTVRLAVTKVFLQTSSPDIGIGGGTVDPGDIDTKESKDIWDSEW